MKRFLNFKTMLAVGFLALAGFGLAQDGAPGVPLVIATWFGSAAAFAAGVIVPLVSFLKTHVIKGLSGWGTIITSLVIGLLGGVVGSLPFAGYFDSIQAGLTFGFSAAVMASGGWDAVVGLLGKREPVE